MKLDNHDGKIENKSNVEEWPINNFKVKCSEFGQNVFDKFWTYPSQIVCDKLRGLPISLFWSCDTFNNHSKFSEWMGMDQFIEILIQWSCDLCNTN